jgi:hypothetical protein
VVAIAKYNMTLCFSNREVSSIVFHKSEMTAFTNRMWYETQYVRSFRVLQREVTAITPSDLLTSSNILLYISGPPIPASTQRAVAVGEIIAHDMVDVFSKANQ